MSKLKSFIIKELNPDLEFIQISYPIEGFHYKLKKNNSLHIKEIVIVNKAIINELISYYFNKKYKKILEDYMNALQDESTDNSSDTGLLIALDETSRLRSILIRKYKTFLSKKNEEKFLKKIKILENEIRSKIIDFRLIKEQELTYTINIEEKSKSR